MLVGIRYFHPGNNFRFKNIVHMVQYILREAVSQSLNISLGPGQTSHASVRGRMFVVVVVVVLVVVLRVVTARRSKPRRILHQNLKIISVIKALPIDE